MTGARHIRLRRPQLNSQQAVEVAQTISIKASHLQPKAQQKEGTALSPQPAHAKRSAVVQMMFVVTKIRSKSVSFEKWLHAAGTLKLVEKYMDGIPSREALCP
ncbi:hypothetical protein AC1031_001577 [Aphanomyces cochlioides]|nr:hypothetical protein AC1031_001577 [Aphanomyces cochlioides]